MGLQYLEDNNWTENLNLAKYCWFGCGGNADKAYFPNSENKLINVLCRLVKENIKYTIIGAGSNIFIRETGLKGVTIFIGKKFAKINDTHSDTLNIEAGALCANIALSAAKKGIAGLEFMVGIPGTLGGAIRMNSGCHGSNMSNVLSEVTIWTSSKGKHVLKRSQLTMNYRSCQLDIEAVILSAKLFGVKGLTEDIRVKTHSNKVQRKSTQPIIRGTGGSTFKNPFGPEKEPKAWQLIDKSQCRGIEFQGAMVSTKHCNFLINNSSATSYSIEVLGEYIKRKVQTDSNVRLNWEIHRLGELNNELIQKIEVGIKELSFKYN